MKVSYNWLEEYFSEKLPRPEELALLLNRHSFEIDGLEKVGDDMVIDADVLPNRAHDCLGHLGLAREIGIILDREVKEPILPSIVIDEKVPTVPVSNEAGLACKLYLSRKIEGVQVGMVDEVIAQRLKSFDQRSVNSLVDLANYAMFASGQPLHIFDADKVEGEIVVRWAKAGEKMITLDGQEVELSPEILLIADLSGPLAIAGIKGGKKAEVTPETKNIILESANFDPVVVRRGSQLLGIRTDASKRFENGLALLFARLGIETLTALILEGNKEVRVGSINVLGGEGEERVSLEIPLEKINRYLGFSLSEDALIKILEQLKFDFTVKKDVVVVSPPVWRQDLKIKEDVIEEIVRLYGYDNVPGKTPAGEEVVGSGNLFWFLNSLRKFFLENGFAENLSYTFTPTGIEEIANPLTLDRAFLRTDLVENLRVKLVDNLQHNIFENEPVCLFEIGNVFPGKGEEDSRLIFGVAHRKLKFKNKSLVMSQVMEKLQKSFSLDMDLESQVISDELTTILEIPLSKFKLDSIGDFDLTEFLKTEVVYSQISPYPRVVRDVAVFVSSETGVEEVVKIIRQNLNDWVVAGPILFDEFIKDNQKSLAFRIIFQAGNKTLSDEEVNAVMDKVYLSLKQAGFEIR